MLYEGHLFYFLRIFHRYIQLSVLQIKGSYSYPHCACHTHSQPVEGPHPQQYANILLASGGTLPTLYAYTPSQWRNPSHTHTHTVCIHTHSQGRDPTHTHTACVIHTHGQWRDNTKTQLTAILEDYRMEPRSYSIVLLKINGMAYD